MDALMTRSSWGGAMVLEGKSWVPACAGMTGGGGGSDPWRGGGLWGGKVVGYACTRKCGCGT